MFYLLLTIITSVLIIVSFKLFHIYKLNTLQVITISYLFSFTYGILFNTNGISLETIYSNDWFIYAMLIGIIFIGGFYLFSKSTEKAGVSITAVSSKMSVIIPVIAGFLIFGDKISAVKVIGIMLAIASFYFILKPEKKDNIDYKYIVLPLLLFFVSGMNDLSVKYVEHNFLKGETLLFLSIIFFSAFCVGILLLFISNNKNGRKIVFSSFVGAFILGSLNFWNAWAFIKSMSIFETSILFPIVNVSVVSLATIGGVIIFKEKIRPINLLGILMAIVAISIISMTNAS